MSRALDVQSPALLHRVFREGRPIDQSVLEEGVQLTAIGMGTAFALLLLLTGIIVLMGRLFGSGSRQVSEKGISASLGGGADARDKALAAVVAVSAVLGKRDGSGSPGGLGHSPGTAAPRKLSQFAGMRF